MGAWASFLAYIQDINTISVTLRLLLATLLSGLIGLNREKKQQAAGFRTHILVCIASALVMLTNLYIFNTISHGQGDVTRMAAQVISGIGFLGTGTIMISGRQPQIKGLTTAASLWAVACIGLAVGCGFYGPAIGATVLILIVVSVLTRIDEKYRSKVHTIHMYVEISDISVMKELILASKALQYRILSLEMAKGTRQGKNKPTAVMLLLESDNGGDDALIETLEKIPGVHFVTSLNAV
jgi:putative Mg2+ transporter-C (MgtC) family protein